MSSPPRVLVVDDNRALAENLAEVLESKGFAVQLAGSCAEARRCAEAGVDVALVDLRLPDGEGTALTALLQGEHPDCAVILLTGFGTVESAAEAVRAGAWDYLLKPCAVPDLLRAVERAMRQVTVRAEKRALTRRAQVAEKLAAVGTLTAGLSHEIRNPLNAATLQLDVLMRRVQKLEAAQQAPLLGPLGLVREEIQRLGHVLEDFLQFARPVQFVPVAVDVAALCGSVHALLTGDAERRGLRLAFSPPGGPVLARGDEQRLRQVLMNLTLNALDATPSGSEVRIDCGTAGPEEVQFEVRDGGPGISPELAARIFEPFFTTKATGSGLGLAIVHTIVDQHGGQVTAESVPSGGACFRVRLPASRMAAAGQAETDGGKRP